MSKQLNMFRPPGNRLWGLLALITVWCIAAIPTTLFAAPQTCYATTCGGDMQDLATQVYTLNSGDQEEQGRICDLIAPTVSSDMCVGRDNNGKNAAPFNCSTNMIAVPTLALRTAATEPVAWQASNFNCGRRTTAHPQIEPGTKAS